MNNILTQIDEKHQERLDNITLLPKNYNERVYGYPYIYKNEVRIWDGQALKCEHGKTKRDCKECKGSNVCQHNKRKTLCKECCGGNLCKHDLQRSCCKKCNPKLNDI